MLGIGGSDHRDWTGELMFFHLQSELPRPTTIYHQGDLLGFHCAQKLKNSVRAKIQFRGCPEIKATAVPRQINQKMIRALSRLQRLLKLLHRESRLRRIERSHDFATSKRLKNDSLSILKIPQPRGHLRLVKSGACHQ